MHSEWVGIHNRASPNTQIREYLIGAMERPAKNALFDYPLNFVIDLSVGTGL